MLTVAKSEFQIPASFPTIVTLPEIPVYSLMSEPAGVMPEESIES
jgi:hypothetical protein